MNKYSGMLAMAFASTLSACGLSRTTDDQENDEVREETAKIQGVAGTYSGYLVDNQGDTLGFLTLDLSANTLVDKGGSRNRERAVLQSELTLQNLKTYKTSFPDGSFNSDTRAFRSSLVINRSADLVYNVQLAGRVDGDKVLGTLRVDGFADRTGNFTLVKNAPMPASDEIEVPPSTPYRQLDFGGGLNYAGSVQWAELGNKVYAVQMRMLSNTLQSDQQFTELLVTRRVIATNVILSETGRPNSGVPFSFPNTIWDSSGSTQTLSGSMSSGAAGGIPNQILFNCTSTDIAMGWTCRLTSSQSGSFTDFTVRASN